MSPHAWYLVSLLFFGYGAGLYVRVVLCCYQFFVIGKPLPLVEAE